MDAADGMLTARSQLMGEVLRAWDPTEHDGQVARSIRDEFASMKED